MSDRVIRLGGSHIGNPKSIQNLNVFLSKEKGRNFVVVSAIPPLLQLVETALVNVFESETDNDSLKKRLLAF